MLWLAMPAIVEAQYSFTTNNGTLTITAYTGSAGALVIPEQIAGLPVTSIGDRAFVSASSLTSVVIPDSILMIGENAFADCTNLVEAKIGSGVISIGLQPFSGCTKLDTLTIDALNPYYYCVAGVLFNRNQTTLIQALALHQGTYVVPETVTTIEMFAFLDNSTVTNMVIGNAVTSIADYAFEYCYNLATLTVAAQNPVYGSRDGVLTDQAGTTLLACPQGRTGTYTVPDGIITIAYNAFFICTNLTEVICPDSVASVAGAFVNCFSLTNITIGNSITNLVSPCYGCDNLKTITVSPANAVYTGENGVVLSHDRTRLLVCPSGVTGSFTVPDQVTEIAGSAFGGCASLTNLIIPASVTNIGFQAFTRCSQLSSIMVSSVNPAFSDLDGALFDKNRTKLLFLPSGKTSSFAIPDSVTNIAGDAFISASALTHLTIGTGFTASGNYLFNALKNLKDFSVAATNPKFSSRDGNLYDKSGTALVCYAQGKGGFTVPAGVTWISAGAFGGCTNLTSLNIPDEVTTIGYGFAECLSLTNISIGAGVADVSSSTFAFCSSLSSINVSPANPFFSSKDGVLFDHNQSTLVYFPNGKTGSFTLPATVTTFDFTAFGYAGYPPGLNTINVDPQNPVFSSRDGVLFNKDQTTLIWCPPGRNGNYVIPDTVTAIGDGAFEYCTNLTGIKLNDSITNIGSSAFAGCFSLLDFTIGSKVTHIGSDGLGGCAGRIEIHFLGDAPQIEPPVFRDIPPAAIYYRPNTTGWEATFDGQPTTLWDPQIVPGGSTAGPSGIPFHLTGHSNQVVVVEAATNLLDPVWTPVEVAVLADGSAEFQDPQWTNYSGRFYRLRSP